MDEHYTEAYDKLAARIEAIDADLATLRAEREKCVEARAALARLLGLSAQPGRPKLPADAPGMSKTTKTRRKREAAAASAADAAAEAPIHDEAEPLSKDNASDARIDEAILKAFAKRPDRPLSAAMVFDAVPMAFGFDRVQARLAGLVARGQLVRTGKASGTRYHRPAAPKPADGLSVVRSGVEGMSSDSLGSSLGGSSYAVHTGRTKS